MSLVTSKRILRAFLFMFLLTGLGVATWLGTSAYAKRDRLFRGKLESEWVKNLKYWDEAQTKEWRGYGEEGVRVLVRGLQNAQRPGERAYRKIHPRLTQLLLRFLPNPKQDSTRVTRHCVVELISSLGPEADIAAEPMMDVVLWDEAYDVRQSALNFFNNTEDENSRLNKLSPSQKARLLPGLLRALQSNSNWGLRNNAAISLRFYPEAREVVAPALEAALSDGEPHVRLLVAEALNRVDPQRARKAGVTALVAEIARAQGDQIASRAVRALTSKGSDPITALPALTEALRSTNTLVSSSAVWALQRAPSEFVEYAPLIVTALVTAAERDDATGRYAKVALKEWKSRADGGSAPESR